MPKTGAAVREAVPNLFPSLDIADSVRDVADGSNPYAAGLLDRRIPLSREAIEAVLNHSVIGWEGRRPTPALDGAGNFVGTDLDLFSFLVGISRRGPVIEVANYHNRRQVVKREGERRVGSATFGKIVGLTSHKDVLSFSVLVVDPSIIRTWEDGSETMGAFRNYMLVDLDGHWYDGWDHIKWKPSVPENAFLEERRLWTGNTVYFKHWVHPNRYQALYGAPYMLTKLAVDRINDEAEFYSAEMRRLEATGIFLPDGEKKPYEGSSYVGDTRPITVRTIEAIFDHPPFTGSYKPVSHNQKGLIEAYRRRKYLRYTLRPALQFVARADEAAFMHYGGDGLRLPYWAQGAHWLDFQESPRHRIVWSRMELAQGAAMRVRIRDIKQQVSA